MPTLKVKNNGIWETISGGGSGTGGSSVNIDATLTQSGQAADAKAVGDALAKKQPVGDYALKSEIIANDFIEITAEDVDAMFGKI